MCEVTLTTIWSKYISASENFEGPIEALNKNVTKIILQSLLYF